jgi:hypothetical protein
MSTSRKFEGLVLDTDVNQYYSYQEVRARRISDRFRRVTAFRNEISAGLDCTYNTGTNYRSFTHLNKGIQVLHRKLRDEVERAAKGKERYTCDYEYGDGMQPDAAFKRIGELDKHGGPCVRREI